MQRLQAKAYLALCLRPPAQKHIRSITSRIKLVSNSYVQDFEHNWRLEKGTWAWVLFLPTKTIIPPKRETRKVN